MKIRKKGVFIIIVNDIEILTQKRDEIQQLDYEILKLLEQRVEAAKTIGEIKKKNKKPIYAPEVEKKKIETLSQNCGHAGLVEAIWPVIMCYTRTLE